MTRPMEMHGFSSKSCEHPLYATWEKIKTRCYNPAHHNYHRYGGRGIVVCDEWLHSFATFLDDVGQMENAMRPGYTLDRKDPDGPYSKENCRWADAVMQNQNRRDNCNLTLNGETKCLTEWARQRGVSRETIRNRLRKGWTIEAALNTPARKKSLDTK